MDIYSSSHHPSGYEDVIERDIKRTMPGHLMFKTEEGRRKLTNVLTAYSRWDEKLGYVQGMNFIVANLLINLPEEEVGNINYLN
jgi:hypothetical protein